MELKHYVSRLNKKKKKNVLFIFYYFYELLFPLNFYSEVEIENSSFTRSSGIKLVKGNKYE